jgi:hypothetical protein
MCFYGRMTVTSGYNRGERQSGKGSFHNYAEFKALKYLLTDGWDAPIRSLIEDYKKLNRDKK